MGENRHLYVTRLSHKHKGFQNFAGIENMMADKVQWNVFVDNVDRGTIIIGEEKWIEVSYDAHEVCLTRGFAKVKASKIIIPAGSIGFNVLAFNNELFAGPEIDIFGEEVTNYMLELFRGQVIRECINMKNNSWNDIFLEVFPEYVELSWQVAKAKGWEQWSTGKDKKKIQYSIMNIESPYPTYGNNCNYWMYLEEQLKRAIVQDDKANMERDEHGGFRPRR